jgi:hypothetical protein
MEGKIENHFDLVESGIEVKIESLKAKLDDAETAFKS